MSESVKVARHKLEVFRAFLPDYIPDKEMTKRFDQELTTILGLLDSRESTHFSLRAALEVIENFKSNYPTDVFPEDGKSIDCISARMARHVCEVLTRDLINASSESPPKVASTPNVDGFLEAAKFVRWFFFMDAGNGRNRAHPDFPIDYRCDCCLCRLDVTWTKEHKLTDENVTRDQAKPGHFEVSDETYADIPEDRMAELEAERARLMSFAKLAVTTIERRMISDDRCEHPFDEDLADVLKRASEVLK